MDIIGKLPVPFTKEGDQFTFAIDENATEVDLRAEFALANREVEAIKSQYEGEFPTEMVERIAVLQGYKKAIRQIILARVNARALLDEDVSLPDVPVKVEAPAPVTEVVAPVAADDDEDDDEAAAKGKRRKTKTDAVVIPDYVIEGNVIVDQDGNRYARVAESMDEKAALIDTKQLESISAAIKPRGGSPLLASVKTDEETDKAVAQDAPLLAALGSFVSGEMAAGAEISATRVGTMALSTAQARNNQATKTYLFRRDRFAPLEAAFGLKRISGNHPVDRLSAELQAQHADALLAAFCGPGELNRDQRVSASTARPIATALSQANSPVAIGLGIHEFFRAIGLADLHATYAANPSAPKGIQQWNATDQAAVDTADPSTWKQCFTLPACPSTVQVSAYFLWRCLRVTVEDQMSRPQYIDNITTLMEAMLARSAEAALLATFDAWSFQRTVPNTTTYGALAQLYWAAEQIMAWATSGSRIDRSEYSMIVPEFLVNLARIDAFNAGENPDQVMDRLQGMVGDKLIITPDWGAEGNPMAPMPVQPTPDSAAAGNGTAIPLMPTTAVIRVLALDDFVWGQTGVVDYGMETSPDLRRQNAAMWFGEAAEIAYKNGARPSFTLTLEDVVPNGGRADRVTPFGLSDQAYNNTLPNLLKAGLVAAQYSTVVDSGS